MSRVRPNTAKVLKLIETFPFMENESMMKKNIKCVGLKANDLPPTAYT